MQLAADDEYELVQSTPADSYQIDVGDPAIVFDMLCNRTYRFPRRTMVQEYMANARDAHREIDNDTPIKVVLPTTLSPVLEITDYGPGISPDRMTNIFVKIGRSTKRDSNTQHGGYGIGAKVGFAYGDTFTIISRNAGVSCEYMAYRSAERLGFVDKLGERPYRDGEVDGVSIVIPIKSDDHYEIACDVLRCSYFWPCRPRILNLPAPLQRWAERSPKVPSGRHTFAWRYDEARDFHREVLGESDVKPLILIDGIVYGHPSESDAGFVLNAVVKNTVLIMEVGTIDVSISREDLQYTDRTLARLRRMISNDSGRDTDIVRSEFLHLIDTGDLYNTVKNVHDHRMSASVSSRAISKVWWGPFSLSYSPHSWPYRLTMVLRVDVVMLSVTVGASIQGRSYSETLSADRYALAIPLDPDAVYILDDRPGRNTSMMMLRRAEEFARTNMHTDGSTRFIVIKLHQTSGPEIRGDISYLIQSMSGLRLSKFAIVKKPRSAKATATRGAAVRVETPLNSRLDGGGLDTLFRWLRTDASRRAVVVKKPHAHKKLADRFNALLGGTMMGHKYELFLVTGDHADWLQHESDQIMSFDRFVSYVERYKRNIEYEGVKKAVDVASQIRRLEGKYGTGLNMVRHISRYVRDDSSTVRLSSDLVTGLAKMQIDDPYIADVVLYARLLNKFDSSVYKTHTTVSRLLGGWIPDTGMLIGYGFDLGPYRMIGLISHYDQRSDLSAQIVADYINTIWNNKS